MKRHVHVPPELDSRSFNCGQCGVFAQQDWNFLTVKENANQFGTYRVDQRFKVSYCGSCNFPTSKHLGLPGKDINKDIGELVAGGLPPAIQQALDIVRVVGNECVHPGTLDLRDDSATVSKLFQLVNLIVEKMITEPKQIGAMFTGLPADKLAGIENRDKRP